jgi:hypothetical protein
VYIEGCAISGAAGPGLEARGFSRCVALRCELSGNEKSGVFVHQNAVVEVRGCRLRGNGFAGAECVGPTAELLLDASFVSDSRKGGVFVHSHGRAELRACDVAACTMAGVHVKWGGAVRLHDCCIRNGRKAGVFVEGSDSVLHLAKCSASGNAGPPILVMGGGRCMVDDMRALGSCTRGPSASRASSGWTMASSHMAPTSESERGPNAWCRGQGDPSIGPFRGSPPEHPIPRELPTASLNPKIAKMLTASDVMCSRGGGVMCWKGGEWMAAVGKCEETEEAEEAVINRSREVDRVQEELGLVWSPLQQVVLSPTLHWH